MKRIFLSSILLLWVNFSMMAINMKVGDTKDLSIGNVSHLQGCQWTISHRENVIFTSTPQSYSTDVTIKAIKKISTTAPCVVSCKYYYLDLDPTTGRYTYLRTGYKDWNIFIKESGSDSDSDDPTNNTINLSITNASIAVNEWVDVYISSSYGGKYSWSIDNPGFATSISSQSGKISVRGVCPGETYLRVTSTYGGYAVCKLKIEPKNSYEIGEHITAPTAEGVEMGFEITNLNPKLCYATGVPSKTSGEVTIPLEAHGFIVAGVSDYAGFHNTLINNIIFPPTITRIGNYAFNECKDLNNIELPNELEIIGMDAFHGCTSLTRISIPHKVTSINSSAFHGCTSLKTISFPEKLENIASWAFAGCNSLKQVEFPAYLKSIGNNAFSGCSSLEDFTLPSSIKSIGSAAFRNCTSLKKIVIPDQITILEEETFSGCSNLSEIVIPNSITSIGDYSFYNCRSIMSFYSYIMEPFDLPSDALGVWRSDAVLYVPKGTKQQYSVLKGWRNFGTIVEVDDPTGIEESKRQIFGQKNIVYSINGKMIMNSDNIYNCLPKGIYINKGKKIIIR